MSSEHVEVLRELPARWRASRRAYDGSADDALEDCADELDAAIASLSAPQPPAEAQPVGEAEVMPGTNGGFTAAVFKAADVPVGTKLYTAPPSAPVGDDRWKALIGQWQRRVEAAGYDGVEDALDAAIVARDARLAPTETQAQGGGGFRGLDTSGRPVYGNAPRPATTATPSTSPPSAPVGVEDRARHLLAAALRPHDRMASDWAMEPTFDGYAVAQRDALHAIAAALAQQHAYVGGFTAADMMDARQEGRKEAQQPAAVDGADAQATEIETLRAALAATKAHKENATMSRDGVIKALSEARDELGAEIHRLRAAKGQAEARAERLAEALRELCNVIDGHEVHVAVEGKAAHARAALRDHDQEGKDE